MAEQKPQPVTIVDTMPSELPKEEQTAAAGKMRQAQADQMFGNAAAHTGPAQRADFVDGSAPVGAPPAQGPNLSKEEAEFAANVQANSKAEDLPEEKTPAPTQASNDPLAEAGKAKKN